MLEHRYCRTAESGQLYVGIIGRSDCYQSRLVLRFRSRVSRCVGTWDCGYARPTSRIQYTASSFAQMIVAMFRWVLRPHIHRPHIDGLFPKPAKMHSHVDDMILDRVHNAGQSQMLNNGSAGSADSSRE